MKTIVIDIKVKVGDVFEYGCGCSSECEMITKTKSLFRPRKTEEQYHVKTLHECSNDPHLPLKRIVRGKKTVWVAND